MSHCHESSVIFSVSSSLRGFKGMLNCVGRTGIKITVCNINLNLKVLVRFLSWKCDPIHFTLFLSDYISLSLTMQDNNLRGLDLSDGRVRRALSQESITRFCNYFDFLPPMTYHTKAIIWRTSFIANIFEWTENLS